MFFLFSGTLFHALVASFIKVEVDRSVLPSPSRSPLSIALVILASGFIAQLINKINIIKYKIYSSIGILRASEGGFVRRSINISILAFPIRFMVNTYYCKYYSRYTRV